MTFWECRYHFPFEKKKNICNVINVATCRCMGHNRGWEEAASMLTGASIELKTCNAALLETTGKSWDEVGLLSFHYYF